MKKNSVGVRELKAKLSEYLKEVAEGDVLEVTLHGQTIARILPGVKPKTADPMDLTLEGLANWNGKHLSLKRPKFGFNDGSLASDLVSENRD